MSPIEISDLVFPAFNKVELEKIPLAYGLEIFYEFGGNAYWDRLLERLQITGRYFSIHGPCMTVNLADVNDTAYFQRYEQWQGKREDVQALVKKRLHHIEALAQRMQGAVMVIENVGLNQYNLFNEEEYMALLSEFPTAKSLIDVGHAQVNGWNFEQFIRELGPRITAFHLHDNDGKHDQHLPIGTSSIDWPHLLMILKNYTPQAVLVLEYANGTFQTADTLMEHIETVRKKLMF